MSGLLERVLWPGMYDLVQARASADRLARAERYDELPHRFAELLAGESFIVLGRHIRRCSTLQFVPAERVGRWLGRVASVIVGAHAAATLPVPEPVARCASGSGELHIDPGLDWIPLRPLLADLAIRLGGFRVLARPLLGVLEGCYRPGHEVIELDPARADAETFAHEMGHALDVWFAERPPEQREDFANLLGPWLLADEPATVLAAGELAEEAHAQVTSMAEPDDLPAPGIVSVAAFLALQLDVP